MTAAVLPDVGVARPPSPTQPLFVAAALIAIFVTAWIAGTHGWRQTALVILGSLIGLTLYHSSFSFAGAYRRFFVYRETRGIEAHLLLLVLSTLAFAPVLALGIPGGDIPTGAVAPVGVSVAIGSFLFGIGMQLGGGCGSGTLYTTGGGSTRMAFTLVAFCGGAFLGSLHLDFWQSLPHLREMSLNRDLGSFAGPIVQVGFIAILWLVLRQMRSQSGDRRQEKPSFVRGNWSLASAAVVLSALNAVTLVIAGHPWAITWGFTLWGAKASTLLGWSPTTSLFWQSGYASRALASGLLADSVSTMNIGILAGAFLAAALAGRFALSWRMSWRPLAAAVLGGLVMGYGARLSFGCNIGAFVSGIASTSLHGWQWIAFALPGAWIGVRLRPLFGLRN